MAIGLTYLDPFRFLPESSRADDNANQSLFVILPKILIDKLLFHYLRSVEANSRSPSPVPTESRPRRRRTLGVSKRPATVLGSFQEDGERELIPCMKTSSTVSTNSSTRSSFSAGSPAENKHVQFKTPLSSIMTFGSSMKHTEVFSDDEEDTSLDLFTLSSTNIPNYSTLYTHEDTLFDSNYMNPRLKGKEGNRSLEDQFRIRDEQAAMLNERQLFFSNSSSTSPSCPPFADYALKRQLVAQNRLNNSEAALILGENQWYE